MGGETEANRFQMKRFLRACALAVMVCAGGPALAQDATWIQIEAQPTEAEATARAAEYAARLPDVSGFSLSSGWFAIALGPYPEDEAEARLLQLRASVAIPGDSFLADGTSFGPRIFGAGQATALLATPALPLPEPEAGEETPAEARAAERLLSRAEREEIQIALRASGFYASVIDASFGPGTRRAMGAWQAANGYQPTGILTTLQRRDLVGTYRDALATLNLTPVTDEDAGIRATLPLGVVGFDRYEAPFAHYEGESGARAILISQRGDRTSLAALFDVLQTLEIVPLDGARALRRSDFTLTGANDRILTQAYARLTGDAIKGYMLVWPTGDDYRRQLVLTALEQSFEPLAGVLPDEMSGAQSIDLLAGLSIRKPERAASGFFVSGKGDVLTASETVAGCARIEIGDETGATLRAADDALGVALLTPAAPLSPLAFARLAAAEPRLNDDIALSGYSFGGVLPAPSVTFGTLADVRGLDGDESLHRLTLSAEPGDSGGPVFDGGGAVQGILLPARESARQLPADVAFARDADGIAAFLTANGVTAARADGSDTVAPEDLTALAADMTVLVTCWK